MDLLKYNNIFSSHTIDFNYFSYIGSFTSPPCEEEVVWYIAEKPIPIGYTTLEYFKDVLKITETNENCIDTIELTDNIRHVKDLNKREVYFYNTEMPLFSKFNDDYDKSKINIEQETAKSNKNIKKENSDDIGHFEKANSIVTKYYYVNSDESSNIPGAIGVSPYEAGVLSFSKNNIKIETKL